MNHSITIYHGSNQIIETPAYGKGKRNNDFGLGFYCTESNELAKEWAVSVIERFSIPPVTVGDSLNYCIESTSTFHMPVIHIWEGSPAVVNPMLAKSGRRKSDVLDSIQLASFDLYGTWARTYVVPLEVHELRVLIHERDHYERLATQCINRILNTLTRFGCTLGTCGALSAAIAFSMSRVLPIAMVDGSCTMRSAVGDI